MAIEQEWWKNKLAEDIYETLKLKEQFIPVYHGHSPQLPMRRHLVDWISVIRGDLEICAMAQHLAVYLLDYFMDNLEVEQKYLHLVALVCLLIATKFEDHCEKVPHYTKLNKFIPQNNLQQFYTARQFLDMELNILKFCAWELCIPTVSHFLPYFLQVAVDEDDLRDGFPMQNKHVVEKYLEKHASYFQEISLQDHQFRNYNPSLVASACVAASRICLRLTPTWPKQLELMTDYYLEELLPCLQSMLSTHSQDMENCSRSSSQSYAPQQYTAHDSYLPCSVKVSGNPLPLAARRYDNYSGIPNYSAMSMNTFTSQLTSGHQYTSALRQSSYSSLSSTQNQYLPQVRAGS